MKRTYEKLVRDRIHEIIQESGAECKIRTLDDEEYLEMIDKKLEEELAEYRADGSIEELADLMEVIYAAAMARGYSISELERIRVGKREERGGFDKRILLIETETK